MSIKPAAVADYEQVIATLQEALAKDTDTTRAAAAKGWRVYKAAENDAKGNALYIHMMLPAVTGFDYRPSLLLDELVKELAPELLPKYQDAFAMPPSKLNLTEFANMSVAPLPSPASRRSPAAMSNRKPVGRLELQVRADVEALIDVVQRLALQLEDAVVQPHPKRTDQLDLRAAADVGAEVGLLDGRRDSPDSPGRRPCHRTACPDVDRRLHQHVAGVGLQPRQLLDVVLGEFAYSNSKPTISRPTPTPNPLTRVVSGVGVRPRNAVMSARAGTAVAARNAHASTNDTAIDRRAGYQVPLRLRCYDPTTCAAIRTPRREARNSH